MKLLGWLRNWREQRAALRTVRRVDREQESELARNMVNPLYLAKLAVDAGHLDSAAARWEEARFKLPNHIYESEDSLAILLALRRFDEAETFTREGQRRFPREKRWPAGFALIAERAGNYAEAVKRWKIAQKCTGADAAFWVREAACLRALGKINEAEKALEAAIRRDPEEMGAWIERAKVSDDRRDWVESEARWSEFSQRFHMGFGFAKHAYALAELGRLTDAEAVLKVAARTYPADLEIAFARAQLAERAEDLHAACEYWAEVFRISPYFQPGYTGRVECLFRAGRHPEADAVMRDAITRFPDEKWPLFEFARLAHRQENWNEAATRWEKFRLRFPDTDEGYAFGREALIASGREPEAAALRRVS